MSDENKQQKINLELIHYQIGEVKNSIERVNKFIDEEAIRRKDFEGLQQTVGNKASRPDFDEHKKDQAKKMEEMKLLVAGKLDKEDFKPYKEALTRINWLIIASVIGAVLTFVINMKP